MGLECSGKTVLITGSSKRIGKALSKLFAADGANLALTDLASKKTPGCLVK